MTFSDCLMRCAAEPELVKEYNRLTGASIGLDTRSPLDRMIDEATGHAVEVEQKQAAELAGFCEFVYSKQSWAAGSLGKGGFFVTRERWHGEQ